MGSPIAKDAESIQCRFVETLLSAKEENAAKLLNLFRKYLQVSGLVRRHSKPLESQYWATEYQREMLGCLKDKGLLKTQGLLIRPHIYVYGSPMHKRVSIILGRSPEWLLLTRNYTDRSGVEHLNSMETEHCDSVLVLERLKDSHNGAAGPLHTVRDIIDSAAETIMESVQRKMQQTQADAYKATTFQAWQAFLRSK